MSRILTRVSGAALAVALLAAATGCGGDAEAETVLPNGQTYADYITVRQAVKAAQHDDEDPSIVLDSPMKRGEASSVAGHLCDNSEDDMAELAEWAWLLAEGPTPEREDAAMRGVAADKAAVIYVWCPDMADTLQYAFDEATGSGQFLGTAGTDAIGAIERAVSPFDGPREDPDESAWCEEQRQRYAEGKDLDDEWKDAAFTAECL